MRQSLPSRHHWDTKRRAHLVAHSEDCGDALHANIAAAYARSLAACPVGRLGLIHTEEIAHRKVSGSRRGGESFGLLVTMMSHPAFAAYAVSSLGKLKSLTSALTRSFWRLRGNRLVLVRSVIP